MAREIVLNDAPFLNPFIAWLPDWLVVAIAAGLVAGFGIAAWRFARMLFMRVFTPSQHRDEQPAQHRYVAAILAGQDQHSTSLSDIIARQAFEPALTLREVDEGAGDRLFFFGARDRIPFFGREQEFAALQDWLSDSRALSWALITGPGGAGKSRLAFELAVKARATGWRAGFLGRRAADRHADLYSRFVPSKPTLIIIDYAARDPEQVGAIFQTISGRAEALTHPVRFLLLEREGRGGQWWSRFAAGQHVELDNARGLQRPLEDPGDRPLLEIMAWAARPKAIPSTALSMLRKIDPKGRPFYAALAGAAIKEGRDMRLLSRAALENDLLKRESERWGILAGGDTEAVRLHRNAAALATMVGGLRLPEEVCELDAASFPFSRGVYDDALMREITGKAATEFIAPIEPDILGERFVLRHLAYRDLEYSTPWDTLSAPIAALLSAVHFRIGKSDEDAEAFAAFLDRLAADCADEAFESGLYDPPSSGISDERLGLWAAGARSAVARFGIAGKLKVAQSVYSEIKTMSAAIPGNEKLAIQAAMAAANLINFGGTNEDLTASDIAAELQNMSAIRAENDTIAAISAGASFGLGMIEELERVFESIKVPADERTEVRSNLMEAIAADLLVRLGERLNSEQIEELQQLGLNISPEQSLPSTADILAPGQTATLSAEGMQALAAFFRRNFPQKQIIEVLSEATKSVADEFADAMNEDNEVRYKRALEINPNDADTLVSYALYLEERDELDSAETYYRRAVQADPTHGHSFRRYANFLVSHRNDPDAAEEYYKRAIEAVPNSAKNLGWYAYFLAAERKDNDGALNYYRRAFEADPSGDLRVLANYSELLFLLGRADDGSTILTYAIELASRKSDEEDLCELNIYRLAYLSTQFLEGLTSLKALVANNVRCSKGADFTETLAWASTSKHAHLALLSDLVEVLTSNADPDILDQHQAWLEA